MDLVLIDLVLLDRFLVDLVQEALFLVNLLLVDLVVLCFYAVRFNSAPPPGGAEREAQEVQQPAVQLQPEHGEQQQHAGANPRVL